MVKSVIVPQTDDMMITNIGLSSSVFGTLLASSTGDKGARDNVVLGYKYSGISGKLFLPCRDGLFLQVTVVFGISDTVDDLPKEELKYVF